eukprot:GAFH01001343.1.p1 GENE.GAFH01001343.1~~GAFH01001343.1.p1  ORF type:complete len:417 (+),score=88.51 GAFH01001343.1:158-1252(+)
MGYGFIEYSHPEEAAKAIAELNGKPLGNKRLKLSYARPSSPEIQNSNLYVSGLAPPYFVKENFESLFSPYGQIIDSKVLVDPATGQGRGVGFVRFSTQTEAQLAIQMLNNTVPQGLTKPIQVKPAESFHEKQRRVLMRGGLFSTAAPAGGQQSASPVPPTGYFQQQQGSGGGDACCLFVYGLSGDCDEATIYRMFAPFGAIGNIKIIRDQATQQCRGYAFVNMLHATEAQNAVLNLNGFILKNRQLQVSFKSERPHMPATPGGLAQSTSPVPTGLSPPPMAMPMATQAIAAPVMAPMLLSPFPLATQQLIQQQAAAAYLAAQQGMVMPQGGQVMAASAPPGMGMQPIPMVVAAPPRALATGPQS